ncbi:hypothetical protein CBR_g19836 [Chara braunii]|uniref:Uncharacterized protein n=1 Tax=Chara braunii TaxID=69332 RepID=A0A388JU71_CHABU|nr:hypothetical protein CBR_g19836 [Chara braunii]|eukprot:GBG61303.1 hypothetical protein CBR_g19836 [Chara braunii]
MMLEALRDIEIAAKLVSEEGDEGEDALDTNYKKLKCPIVPLPQDGPEFNLIKKYLKNTHAPTHKSGNAKIESLAATFSIAGFRSFITCRLPLAVLMPFHSVWTGHLLMQAWDLELLDVFRVDREPQAKATSTRHLEISFITRCLCGTVLGQQIMWVF